MDKKLYRDPRNGMLAGVCAGIAEYFGWDPTWVRLGAVHPVGGQRPAGIYYRRGDHSQRSHRPGLLTALPPERLLSGNEAGSNRVINKNLR